MHIWAHDIKSGDTFRYTCDWDFFGKPISSAQLVASSDAIVVGTQVMIPFGGNEGHTYMAEFGSKVEKIDGTE